MSYASESEWPLHNVENTTKKGREKKRAHMRACALGYICIHISYNYQLDLLLDLLESPGRKSANYNTYTHTHIHTCTHTHKLTVNTRGFRTQGMRYRIFDLVHIRISHITNNNALCHTHERVTSHM